MTFRIEQAVDAEVGVGRGEGVVEAGAGAAAYHRRIVEQLRPPSVQQRVERQPVAPARREVPHVHARVVLNKNRNQLDGARRRSTAREVNEE